VLGWKLSTTQANVKENGGCLCPGAAKSVRGPVVQGHDLLGNILDKFSLPRRFWPVLGFN
jgi:hypothetical protein